MTLSDGLVWSEKHRPQRFEDVVGQEAIVERLQGIVRSGHARHVIFSGPSGSGKTTLAQIYAQALMCEEPLETGSPCFRCDSCIIFAEPGGNPNYHAVNCALHGTKEEIAYLLETKTASNPLWARRHVAFLDEAHRLSLQAQDVLLVPLERDSQSRVVIFGLIDERGLAPQVRSRFRIFSLVEAAPEDARRYLERICQLERVAAETDALALIVAFSRGLREAALNLQTVVEAASGQAVSCDLVRQHLLSDRSGRLLDYLNAVAASDLAGQLQALATSRMSAADTLRGVQDALLHLKLRFVGPTLAPSASATALLLADEDCRHVVTGFAHKAEALGTTLQVLFDEILEFWSFLPLTVTDSVLAMHATRFHDIVSLSANLFRPPAQLPPPETYKSSKAVRTPPAWRRSSKTPSPDGEAFMNYRQAREIYNAATSVIQAYGKTFNAAVTLTQTGGDDREYIDAMSDMLSQLAVLYAGWQNKRLDAGPLHRIAVNRRKVSGRLETTVILHLAPDVRDKAEAWLRAFGGRPAINGQCKLNLEIFRSEVRRDQIQLHWNLVRRLWTSVDPSIVVDNVPLLDRLQVPLRARGSALALKGRWLSFSKSIGGKAWEAAQLEALPHRSALDERDWDCLFAGWEFQAFKDREETVSRRMKRDRELEGELNASVDALSRRVIQQLLDNEG